MLLVLSLAAALDHGQALLSVDRPVQAWALEHRWRWAEAAARTVTELGAPAAAFVAGLVLAAVVWRRDEPVAVAVLALTLARPVASRIVKELVDRDRPPVGALVGAAGRAFPSGHTLAATVLFGSLVLVAAGLGAPRVPWIAAACALVVAAVGFSRVYLGVHWLSDVLGGALLGAVLLCCAWIVLVRGGFQALAARLRSLR